MVSPESVSGCCARAAPAKAMETITQSSGRRMAPQTWEPPCCRATPCGCEPENQRSPRHACQADSLADDGSPPRRLRADRSGRALSSGGRNRGGAAAATRAHLPLSGLQRMRQLRLPRHAGSTGRVLFAGLRGRGGELSFGPRLRAARAQRAVSRFDEGAPLARSLPAALRADGVHLLLRAPLIQTGAGPRPAAVAIAATAS